MPNHRALSPAIERAVVAAYQDGSPTVQEVADRFGVKPGPVRRALRRAGVPNNPRRTHWKKLDDEKVVEIIRRYQGGESIKAIARTLDVSDVTIAVQLRRHGVEIRSISEQCRTLALDESAFDDPGPAGRYWCGFLMADGAVVRGKRWNTAQIVLALSSVDRGHVEAFRDFLKSDAAILDRPGTVSAFPRGHTSCCQPSVRLSVNSTRLADALARYGVVPRKSLTAEVCGLELCPWFWAGVVDGDGTVGWHKTISGPIPLVRLVGARRLMEQFSAFVRSLVPEAKAAVRPAGTIWCCVVAGAHAMPVIRALYADNPYALPRKKAITNDLLKWVSRKWQTKPRRPCLVGGCDRHAESKGYCHVHYSRLRKSGRLHRVRADIRPYTREQLEALYAEHGTWWKVAKAIGAHRMALQAHRRKLGMPDAPDGKRPVRYDSAYLQSLFEQHGTWQEVARVLGMHKSFLSIIRNREGMAPAGRWAKTPGATIAPGEAKGRRT